jgi:hypothetical protein
MDYGLTATGGVLGSNPPLILSFALQRYIVAGLTADAVKGQRPGFFNTKNAHTSYRSVRLRL